MKKKKKRKRRGVMRAYLLAEEGDGLAQLAQACTDHGVAGGHGNLARSLAELELLEEGRVALL
jgi:hypothetical protein